LARRLEAKNWTVNALTHKNTLLNTRLSVVKEQFRAIQTLFEHVLRSYKSLSKHYKGHILPSDEHGRLPHVRKQINPKDITRVASRRASIMAFRLQAFQLKSSNLKTSFGGDTRQPSQAPSLTDEGGTREVFSAKAIDKLLGAIKSGDEDDAELIQKRCEEMEICISDIQTHIYASHKSEMNRWGQFLGHLQDNYEKELTKRQEDIRQLNCALSTWVRKFLDLQGMLLPQDYGKCGPKGEDVLRILERTQLLAAESMRDMERFSGGSVTGRTSLERHEGDYGEEVIELGEED